MANPKHLPPSALDEWLGEVAALLELDPADVPIAKVLDLAKDVAHGVARPAAPLTTFLVGLALGRASASEAVTGGADADENAGASFDVLAAKVTALAEEWESRPTHR